MPFAPCVESSKRFGMRLSQFPFHLLYLREGGAFSPRPCGWFRKMLPMSPRTGRRRHHYVDDPFRIIVGPTCCKNVAGCGCRRKVTPLLHLLAFWGWRGGSKHGAVAPFLGVSGLPDPRHFPKHRLCWLL